MCWSEGLTAYAMRYTQAINEVMSVGARLLLAWVTVCGLITISVCNQPARPTQPGHPSMGKRNEQYLRIYG